MFLFADLLEIIFSFLLIEDICSLRLTNKELQQTVDNSYHMHHMCLDFFGNDFKKLFDESNFSYYVKRYYIKYLYMMKKVNILPILYNKTKDWKKYLGEFTQYNSYLIRDGDDKKITIDGKFPDYRLNMTREKIQLSGKEDRIRKISINDERCRSHLTNVSGFNLLPNLVDISIIGTFLENVDELFSFKRLKWLNLWNNMIREISVKTLHDSLVYLHLSDNPIRNLPEIFFKKKI